MTFKKALRWLAILILGNIGLLSCAQFQPDPSNQLTEKTNIPYGKAGGETLKLDFYPPARSAGVVPAIIFIHGGGWVSGDKQDFSDLARGLADQGYACFSINYRLASPGKNLFPAAYDDAQRAVRWVRSQAGVYSINPDAVILLGASAGGHLVSLLGTTDTRDNSDLELANFSSRPTCVIDLFGPADLTAAFTRRAPDGGDIQAAVETFMGETAANQPDRYRQASPIFNIDSKTVPFLIFQGSVDQWVYPEQSRQFSAALEQAGADVTYIEFEGEGHGFEKAENTRTFIKQTLNFLKKCSPAQSQNAWLPDTPKK